MQRIEEVASSWKAGALVIVKMGDMTMYRPAAFVFADGDGVVWVEPAYLDQTGASAPAEHRAGRAKLQQFGQAFNIVAEGEAWSATLAEYDPEEDADQIGPQIDFLFQQLEAAGTSWEDERERVRAIVFGTGDITD